MDRKTLDQNWKDTAIQLFGNKPQAQQPSAPVASPDYSLEGGTGGANGGPSVLNRIFGVLGAQQQGVLGAIRGVQEIEQESRSGNFDPTDLLRVPGGVVGGLQDSLAVTFGGKGDNLQTPEDIVTRQYAMGAKDIPGGNFDTSKNAAATAGMTSEQLEQYRKQTVKPQYEEYKKNSSVAEKGGRMFGDLAMYVATDPLTYQTAGISAGVKGLYAAIKGAKDITKGAQVANAAEATIANVPEGITGGQAMAAQRAGRILEARPSDTFVASQPKALEAGSGQMALDFPTNVVAKPAEQLAPKIDNVAEEIPGQMDISSIPVSAPKAPNTVQAAVEVNTARDAVKASEAVKATEVVTTKTVPVVEDVPKSFKTADEVITAREAKLAEQSASKTPKTDALVETPKYDPITSIELEPGVVVPRTPVTEKAAELIAKSNQAFEETRAAGKLPPRIGNRIFGSERATNIVASIIQNPIFKAKGVGVVGKAQELLDPFKIVSIGGKQFTLDIQALAQILTKVPGAESTPILTKFVDPITESLGATRRIGEVKVQKLDAKGKVVPGSEEVQSISNFDPATLLTQVLTGMGDDANRVGMHTLEDILTGGKEGITVDSVMSLSGGVKITVGDFLKEMKLARKEADNYLKSRAAIVVMEDSAKPLMQAAKTPAEAEKASVAVEETYQAIKESPELTVAGKSPEQPPHRMDSTVRDGRTQKKPSPKVDSPNVTVQTPAGSTTVNSINDVDNAVELTKRDWEAARALGTDPDAIFEAGRQYAVARMAKKVIDDVFTPRVNINYNIPNAKPRYVPITAEAINDPKLAMYVGKTPDELRAMVGDEAVIYGHSSIKKMFERVVYGKTTEGGKRDLMRFQQEGSNGQHLFNGILTDGKNAVGKRAVSGSDEHAMYAEQTLLDIEKALDTYGIPQVLESGYPVLGKLSERLALKAKQLNEITGPDSPLVRPGHFLMSQKALENSLLDPSVKAAIKKMKAEDFIDAKKLEGGIDFGAPKSTKMPSPEAARNPQTGRNVPNEAVRVQTERIAAKTGGKTPVTIKETEALGRADDPIIATLIEDSVDATIRSTYSVDDVIKSQGINSVDDFQIELGFAGFKGPEKWSRVLSARQGLRELADNVLFNNLGLGRRIQGELDNFGKQILKTKATPEEIRRASDRLVASVTDKYDMSLLPKLTAKEQEVFDLLNLQVGGTYGKTESIFNSTNLSMEHISKYLGAVGFRGGMRVDGPSNYSHPFMDLLDRLRPTDALNGQTAIDMFHANPVEFMAQMHGALMKATTEKFIKNDLMYTVGKATAEGLSNPVKVGGRYFEKEIAQQVPRLFESMNDLLTYTSRGGTILRSFDEIQSVWKTLNTIIIPGHHIRNMNGDLFMSFLSSPRYGMNPAAMVSDYKDAVSILRNHADWYGGIFKQADNASYDTIVQGIESKLAGGPGFNVASKSGGKTRTVLTVGDKSIDESGMYGLYFNRGGLNQLHVVEDLNVSGGSNLSDELTANANVVKKLARANAKLQNTPGIKQAGGLSVSREHSIRMMDFVGDLKSGLAKEFKGRKNIPQAEWDAAVARIADDSAKRIRKVHPTGETLTGFERDYLRRVFPFYSYTRGIVPSFLEYAAYSPAKALVPNKVYSSVQQNFYSGNVNPATGKDPNLPTLPDWVYGAYPQGPLFGIETPTGTAAIASNPGQTSLDLPKQLLDPRGTLASNLTPGLKLPFEAVTKKDSRTGQNLDWTDWAIKNTPVASVIYRGAAGAAPGAQPGSVPWLNVFNSFTGAGAQEINKESYIKSAQFQQRD